MCQRSPHSCTSAWHCLLHGVTLRFWVAYSEHGGKVVHRTCGNSKDVFLQFTSTRRAQRHSFQIVEWPRERNLQIMRCSALGMIRVYNLLPQEAIEKDDVKSFQSALTQILRDRLNGGDANWRFVFSPRVLIYQNHPLTR